MIVIYPYVCHYSYCYGRLYGRSHYAKTQLANLKPLTLKRAKIRKIIFIYIN